MKKRDLHDGEADGLLALESIDLGKVDSFVTLVRSMGKTAFGGRSLGQAFDVCMRMARDSRCRVVLTLSGAMTVAKQGGIICEMIDRGLVQAIVSTGALICHGITESLGGIHYRCDPRFDDKELFEMGYNRVYDTLEQELNLNEVERFVTDVLDRDPPKDGVWSSARICSAIGRRLDQVDQGPGILRSAWRKGVPVFIPAFTDSEVALDLFVASLRQASDRTDGSDLFEVVPPFNPFLDLQEYVRFVSEADRLGIFTIGGGVPRNWAQQVAPLFDLLAVRLKRDFDEARFRYGVRICPDPPHFGGLSGCTYSEGVSWGKFLSPEEGGNFAEVFADATLVWPLLMKAVFEALDEDPD